MLPDNLIPIILFAAAILLFAAFLNILYFYNVTITRWKEAKATVVSQGAIPDGNGGWEKSITYEYVVDGKKYKNNTFSRNFKSTVPLRHQVSITSGYTSGCEVPVFYDPDYPNKSVLDNTFSRVNYIMLVVSIAFFAIGYYNYK